MPGVNIYPECAEARYTLASVNSLAPPNRSSIYCTPAGLPVLVDHIVVRKMKLQLARALILTALLLTGACKSISKSTESQTSTVTPSRHVTTQCQAFEIAKSALPRNLASNLSGALCDIDLAIGITVHGLLKSWWTK